MSTTSVVVAALASCSFVTACGADSASSDLEGRWDGPGRATITLKADGTAEGNDGCNDMAAAWKPTTDVAGRFAVTESGEMACVDVAGWSEATSYVLSGDTLIIEAGDGEDLDELVRAR